MTKWFDPYILFVSTLTQQQKQEHHWNTRTAPLYRSTWSKEADMLLEYTLGWTLRIIQLYALLDAWRDSCRILYWGEIGGILCVLL